MKIALPQPVRRWRWEWLAVLLSILLYGSCSLNIYGCSRELFGPVMPLEESIERFDSAIPDLEKILQSHGADYREAEPESGFLYTRAIKAVVSNTKITISLARAKSKEVYTIKIMTDSVLTPKQALPDEQLIQSLCEWQSALLEDKAGASLKKKVPAMLATARLHLTSLQADQEDNQNGNEPSVYADHVWWGNLILGDDAYFGINQLHGGTYYSQLSIYCDRSR